MYVLKTTLLAGAFGLIMAASTEAQITVYRPSYSPVVVPAPVVAPVPVAPTVSVYSPPIVSYSTFSPVVAPTYVPPRYVPPSYVAPASVVSPYVVSRPVYPVAPVVTSLASVVPLAPAVTSAYRPAVVGAGVGGVPNFYVPGQPVRNALRFVTP